MFFVLSKVFGFLVNPANFLFVILLAVLVSAFAGWRKLALRIAVGASLFCLVIAVVPFGEWVTIKLEKRFPYPETLPHEIDGIVVLGGVINPWVSAATGRTAFGGNVERIWEAAELARAYPEAKLVFTGGSGRLLDQTVREADFALPVFELLGVDRERVLTERDSRNTAENAVLARGLAQPAPGEVWVLVTNAGHMPRSIGTFRAAGWKDIVALPVDHRFPPGREIAFRFSLAAGLSWSGSALHEVIGLAAYYFTGRTDELFPGPK